MIPSHEIRFTEEQKREILAKTAQILDSGQVILGEHTKAFEDAYAKYCGRLYGVAVGSDTAAFEMQLKTLGVKGEYVLYPALAFPSILESVVNAGGKPWFFDGSWDGHLFARLDVVKTAVDNCVRQTDRMPKALILMHTGGLIARDSQEITDWCESEGIEVLEDAAHSFGATLNLAAAGSFGLSSAFSLYATKPMHACEGGMIVTDDEHLADECRIYRNYGRTQDFGRSVIVRHGYSWRITEIQSVIGLSNLQNIEPNIARRREIMEMYDDMYAYSDSDAWHKTWLLEHSHDMRPNGYRYIVVGPNWSVMQRLEFKQLVRDKGGIDLPGEVYELPTHLQPIWTKYAHLSFPMAEEFCRRHFALPVYPSLTDDQVRTVFTTVERCLEEFVKG